MVTSPEGPSFTPPCEAVRRPVLPPERTGTGRAWWCAPTLYPGGCRRHRRSVPRSRLLTGAAFREAAPICEVGVFQPAPLIGHTPPGPAPAGPGIRSFGLRRRGHRWHETGVAYKRHSAISSLRASATIMTRASASGHRRCGPGTAGLAHCQAGSRPSAMPSAEAGRGSGRARLGRSPGPARRRRGPTGSASCQPSSRVRGG